MSKVMEVYSRSESMEPLFPESARGALSELTCDILRESGGLAKEIPSSFTCAKLKRLTREMNSYYSNLIEGHKTLPKDIEQALKSNFSTVPEKRDNQCLSVAHIKVEELMERKLRETGVNPHSSDFLCWIHREFYSRLPKELRGSETIGGRKYQVEPGEFRNFNVDVGRHTPPSHDSLPGFLNRFEKFYTGNEILATHQLIALAASHHRLAWIHPFGDGNGRVVRLYSHALLIRNKVDGLGLWTISRGLARNRGKYYELLQAADQRRYQDFDGRGNLSDRGLANFCQFFLETMLDQIRFMSGLFELSTLNQRIENYFQREAIHIENYREELSYLVKALVLEEEMPRTRVQEIIRKGESTTRKVIKLALDEGLIETPSERGKLSIAFPSKILESYFPKLFVDLPTT